jgi:hypothetical protein
LKDFIITLSAECHALCVGLKVFDITNNVKDIYLNGTLVMEDLPLSNEDLTDYAPTSLYLVHYNGKTGGAVELDNFKCYYYEAE